MERVASLLKKGLRDNDFSIILAELGVPAELRSQIDPKMGLLAATYFNYITELDKRRWARQEIAANEASVMAAEITSKLVPTVGTFAVQPSSDPKVTLRQIEENMRRAQAYQGSLAGLQAQTLQAISDLRPIMEGLSEEERGNPRAKYLTEAYDKLKGVLARIQDQQVGMGQVALSLSTQHTGLQFTIAGENRSQRGEVRDVGSDLRSRAAIQVREGERVKSDWNSGSMDTAANLPGAPGFRLPINRVTIERLDAASNGQMQKISYVSYLRALDSFNPDWIHAANPPGEKPWSADEIARFKQQAFARAAAADQAEGRTVQLAPDVIRKAIGK